MKWRLDRHKQVHLKVKVDKLRVIGIAKDLNLSDRKVLRVLKHFRTSYGSSSVIPCAREILIKRKDIFSQFFETKTMKFEVKREKVSYEEERPFTYCSDLQDDQQIAY